MDVVMPVLGGLETTRRLKADATTRDIPVLVLTSSTASFEAAVAAGCDAYFEKPCLPQTLLTIVERLVCTPARRTRRAGT
jgi:CheY-like chemotaxis protein